MVPPNAGWHSVDSIPVADDSFQCQLVPKTMINFHVPAGDWNFTGCETVGLLTNTLLYGVDY